MAHYEVGRDVTAIDGKRGRIDKVWELEHDTPSGVLFLYRLKGADGGLFGNYLGWQLTPIESTPAICLEVERKCGLGVGAKCLGCVVPATYGETAETCRYLVRPEIEREASRLKWAWGGSELWVCSGAKSPNGCAFPQDCTHGKPHAFIEGKCEDDADWRKPNWGSACKVAKCSPVYGTVAKPLPAPSPWRKARIRRPQGSVTYAISGDGTVTEQVEIQMEGE